MYAMTNDCAGGSDSGSSTCTSAIQPGTVVTSIDGTVVLLSNPLMGPIDKDTGVIMFSTVEVTGSHSSSTEGGEPSPEAMWEQFNTDGDDTYMSYDEFKSGLQSMPDAPPLPDAIIACLFGKADAPPAGTPLAVCESPPSLTFAPLSDLRTRLAPLSNLVSSPPPSLYPLFPPSLSK